MPQSLDPEIEAMGTILKALEALDGEAQDRVLEYALRRLGRSVGRKPLRQSLSESTPGSVSSEFPEGARLVSPATSDIRSLREQKKPKSANEMSALVAYYLSELAPEHERRDAIGPPEIAKYFKQAQFPLPKATRNTLPNAAAAGYFDLIGRGQYRLNAVGYNLVVHRLPSDTRPSQKIAGGGTAKRSPRKTRSKKTKTGKPKTKKRAE